MKVKTEKHEPCRFSYMVVRSDGQTYRSFTYRGEDAVFVFLTWLQEHEKAMREDMANKRPIAMTSEDWQKHENATECHICNKSLVEDLFLDSIFLHDPDSESSKLRIISYSSWMLVSLYFSSVGSDPLTTWSAGARVTSNTRLVYRACG